MNTVLHVIERLTLGGASRALIGLSKYSSRQGSYRHRILSLLPAQPEAITLAQEEGIPVVQSSVKEVIDQEWSAADLVQVHWWNAPVLQRLLSSSLPASRLLIWSHVVGDSQPNIMTRELINFADLTIASNPYTHQESAVFRTLDPDLRDQKTAMILDPTDFDRVSCVERISHAGFNVGYIGTVGFYKMHRGFVSMSSSVDVPGIKFVVCGGGIEEQLRAEARELGTEERFEFLGYQEDIGAVIAQMDVYGYPLCPDTYASGELNLQEVMYAGVPPVVFPYGGVKRLVIDGFTGRVVTNMGEYRQAIEDLYHNPDERKRLGENAAQYARQMFGAERSASALNHQYHRLMETPKQARAAFRPAGQRLVTEDKPEVVSGGQLFAESMGITDNPFLISIQGALGDADLLADQAIQSMSPVVEIAGLMEYLNQSPRDPWLRYWLALIQIGQSHWQRAMEGLQAAQQLGLSHWRLHWFLAQVAQRLEQTELQRVSLQAVREQHPEFARANGFLDEGDVPEPSCPFPVIAEKVNGRDGKASSIDDRMASAEGGSSGKDSTLSQLHCAEEAWKHERPEEVDRCLDAIAASAFDDPGDYFRRGQLEFNRGRFAAALASLERGLASHEGSVRILTQAAACSLELEQVVQFENYLDRAMKFDASDPLPHKFLAQLNVGQGEFHTAARICHDILQVTPEDLEVLRLLAVCFAAMEDRDAEVATYEEILRLQPDDEDAATRRKTALSRPKKAPAARALDLAEAPDVTAIVSTYNGAAFLPGCLDDLLQQTIVDRMEIIVVDSGSEQAEGEIVARYQEKHTRIQYVRTEERETLYMAWNRALELARGRYIFNANTDDGRRPDAAAKLLEAMEADPGAALAYADCQWTDKANDTFRSENPLRQVSYPSYHPALPLFYCYSGCLQFWRTDSLRELGGFDGNFRAAGDYEVLMRLVKARQRAIHVPECLSLFYQNTSGLTQQNGVSAQEENSCRSEFREHLELSWLYQLPGDDTASLSMGWTSLGCFARAVTIPWHDGGLGDEAFALTCFQKALQLDSANESAAGNLLSILQEHDRLDVGEQFLLSEAIGWTQARWKSFVRGSIKWQEVTLPSAVEVELIEAATTTPSTEDHTQMRTLLWQAPFFNPSGYGSEALNFVAPLPNELPLSISHNSSIVSKEFVSGLLPRDRKRLNDLVTTSPDASAAISLCHGPATCFEIRPGAAYHIGRTMFETDRLPTDWVRRCNLMNEVWVPTEFNRQTFIRSGVEARKIVKIPGAVDEQHFDPERHEPLELPNPAGCNLLSVFEWIWRKGWDVLLRAYFTEFGPEDDVCLYLRTYECNCPDGDGHAALTQRVLAFAASMGRQPESLPRFEILADQVPYQDLPKLYRAVDCLVAPSRGEGWGRPHHEAMMMGVPVIATNWSGNTEFMSDENSFLLPCQQVPVEGVEKAFALYQGHEWAEPSMDDLCRSMRSVLEKPDLAKAKGTIARRDMLQRFSRVAVAAQVQARLQKVNQLMDASLPRLESRSKPSSSSSEVSAKLKLNWVGPFSDCGSLAHVNRRLAKSLQSSIGTALRLVEPKEFAAKGKSRFLSDLGLNVSRKPNHSGALTIRHQWPPDFRGNTGKGPLVVMQPWEFGALPTTWVEQSAGVDEFWVYSEYVRRVYVDSGIEPGKVKVVPLGVDIERFKSAAAPFQLATGKKFKFLFVGGTIARKGPDVLLEAYRQAFRSSDDVTLVIKDFGGTGVYAGQTLEQEIDAFKANPNHPEVVYLKEELSDKEMIGLFHSCDCLVHPYRGEGFGLPVLEAMASGLPVVVTRGGACDDFTPDDCSYGIPALRREIGRQVGDMPLIREGWWLEPSVPALAETLREILDSPETAQAKGARAQRYVAGHWSWQESAERILSLATDLSQRHEAASGARVSVRQRHQRELKLPACARKGDLAGAKGLFSKNRLAAAWDAVLKEVSERPFHPEAYLLLGEIAVKAGDATKARAAAKTLEQMVPDWSPGKQFVRRLRKGKVRSRSRETLTPLPVPAEQPRISVCMIVRNEEAFIEDCLKSVKDFAHQMVVVDTGSTDATPRLAKAMGAEVYSSEWDDDFSKARNEALLHVNGDWVLVLDADERWEATDQKGLWKALSRRKTIGYRLPLHNHGVEEQGESYVPRLFRNAPGLFYVGRIHEQIYSSLEVRRRQWGMENRLGSLPIIHYGYTESMTQDRDKVARNLRLLRLAVDEIPDDPNLLMNLASELSRSGDPVGALRHYRDAFDALLNLPREDVVPELRESLLTQFVSGLIRQQRFEDVKQLFEHPFVAQNPNTASLAFLLGLALMRTGGFNEAVEAFRDSIAKRSQSTYSVGYAEAYGSAPYHCQALCLSKLGRHEEAREAFDAAVENEDVAWEVVRDYAVYLAGADAVLEALTLLHSKFPRFHEDLSYWLLGAEIGLEQPFSCEFALDWIGEGIKQVGQEPALVVEHVRGLLLNDRCELPETWLEQTEPACRTAGAWAVRLIGSLISEHPVPSETPLSERELSFEVIRLYRRLLKANAKTVVEQVHQRLPRIESLTPSAVRIIQEAVKEASTLPV